MRKEFGGMTDIVTSFSSELVKIRKNTHTYTGRTNIHTHTHLELGTEIYFTLLGNKRETGEAGSGN